MISVARTTGLRGIAPPCGCACCFIGASYRLDVTRAVKEGANMLETRPFRMKNPRIVIAKEQ